MSKLPKAREFSNVVPEVKLSLIELEDAIEISKRIKALVDKVRGRASILFFAKEPIKVEFWYRFEETSRGIVIQHDWPENERDNARPFPGDVRDIAAIALRESLRASRLTENPENIGIMLDFVIGSIFRDTRISATQKELTSANRRSMEQTLNSRQTKMIPSPRKALSLNFIENYLDKESKEKQLKTGRGRDKGILSAIDLDYVINRVLKRKMEQSSNNKIFDQILDPGISLPDIRHNGKRRILTVLKLIRNYVQEARKLTQEKSIHIEQEFNYYQAEKAIDAIIGVESIPKTMSKIPTEVITEISRNIRESVDPILWGAIAA